MNGHELFPTEEGEEEINVEWIGVKRRAPNGTMVCAPQMWKAEELDSLKTLEAKYGGGWYELEAREGGQSGKARYSGRRVYILSGPSLPLYTTGQDLGVDAFGDVGEPAQTGGAAQPAARQGLGTGSDTFLLALLQMMQAQSQQSNLMMIESMKAHTALLTSVMGGQKADANAQMQFMASMNAGEKATMAKFFETLAALKSGGGDLQAFMKGIQFRESLPEEVEAGDDSEASALETLSGVVEGIKAFGAMSAQGGGMPPGAASHVPHVAQPQGPPRPPQPPKPPQPQGGPNGGA